MAESLRCASCFPAALRDYKSKPDSCRAQTTLRFFVNGPQYRFRVLCTVHDAEVSWLDCVSSRPTGNVSLPQSDVFRPDAVEGNEKRPAMIGPVRKLGKPRDGEAPSAGLGATLNLTYRGDFESCYRSGCVGFTQVAEKRFSPDRH